MPSGVIPPRKFGVVMPSVYRSAFPSPDSFGHLRLLGLRTVLNLSQEALARPVAAHFVDSGVLLADVGLQVWTHTKCEPISLELIKEAMRFVLSRNHHPLLIVSSSGTQQVGALVGCLRRLQQWVLSSAIEEYRTYAAPSPRPFVEQFIELWDCDLLSTLPASVPPRFGASMQSSEHESWPLERSAPVSALTAPEGALAAEATAGLLVPAGTLTSVIEVD